MRTTMKALAQFLRLCATPLRPAASAAGTRVETGLTISGIVNLLDIERSPLDFGLRARLERDEGRERVAALERRERRVPCRLPVHAIDEAERHLVVEEADVDRRRPFDVAFVDRHVLREVDEQDVPGRAKRG